MKSDKVTILIPANNSLTTIKNTLDSISSLNQNLIENIIYVDDNSIDGSREYVENYAQILKLPLKLIFNQTPQGLAKNYNFGIKYSKSRFLLTMHQDMEVINQDALEKSIQLLKNDEQAALVYSNILHPESLMEKYNFWMKVNFSRVINRPMSFSAGKFYMLDLDKVNLLFNEEFFTHSGEDAGFNIELRKKGFKILSSDVEVIHNHSFKSDYSFYDYLKKESQLNETYGVLLRNYGFKEFGLKMSVLMLHRLFILICFLLPIINIFGFLILVLYSFYFSKKIFVLEIKNPKILLVPFANMIILSSGALWNIIGYIKGKQTL